MTKMELSKATESEIREVYQTYWDAYLRGDMETFGSFLDEHVVIYGTAVGEVFSSKQEALDFYTATADEMTGKAEFRNRDIRIQALGEAFAIYEESQLYILIEGTWTFYGSARLSGILKKKNGSWKIIHQHGSFPDTRTEEGQQVASEKIKEENLQLKEAVYRRTIELENKTYELEIESALERVRTIAMSMRKPDDMLSVCESIALQLDRLKVDHIRNVQTAVVSEKLPGYYLNYQYFFPYQKSILETVEIDKHPSVKAMVHKMQASPEAYFPATFKGKELDEWRKYRKEDNQFPDPILEMSEEVHFHFYSIGRGGLGISTYRSLTPESLNLFHRFRNVFLLAYQRFRDIEQAEMQAREAQIELALERVRARTMAMQHSEELQDTSLLLFKQLKELGEPAEQCTIGIIKESEGVVEINATLHGSKLRQIFRHKLDEPFVMAKMFKSFKDQQRTLLLELQGEELRMYNEYRNTVVGSNTFPVKLLPGDRRIIHIAYFSKGFLALSTNEPRPAESLHLLERFAIVFEQTYTRFLDLQKAEALAREARIESSLEKVRSVAMGMRKPEDLLNVCEQLYMESQALGLTHIRNAIINIHNDEQRTFINYDYSPEIGKSITPLTFDIHPVIEKQIRQVRSADDAFSETSFTGAELEEWKAFRKSKGEKDDPRIEQLSGLYYYLYSIGTGSIGISTFEPAHREHVDILKRFRNVFALAYQRYTEILFAESQAREAQIEAAMERVRSRSMAMRSSDELSDVVKLLYQELDKLNANNASTDIEIGLLDEETGIAAVWAHLYQSDGTIAKFNFPLSQLEETRSEWEAYKNTPIDQRNTLFITNEFSGARLQNLFNGIISYPELQQVFEPLMEAGITKWVTHNAYFSYGIVTLQGTEPYPQETLDIQRRFARVFEQTYIRFLDLKKAEQQTEQAVLDFELLKVEKKRAEEALSDLKEAQSQLIQAEKMASLGELTAGIAHEIQNPLNFVNNFSEVSDELMDEMKHELATGNMKEAIDLANDVKQNLEKILQHGKRADAIVKGMLQHSRTSTGQKELTDINALADEYLRLAYHGLRAKDKSFNATMKTDFDTSIGKINVIPQDIGRVLLNLITNAFHAVSAPKSPKGDLPNDPTIIVSTRLIKSPRLLSGVEVLGDLGAKQDLRANTVEICVSDNGPGIPDAIKDKIFQPFFTTKPTGQGTGLGLSLSYDIIKAHGGELKFESTPGEGTTFTIRIPNHEPSQNS